MTKLDDAIEWFRQSIDADERINKTERDQIGYLVNALEEIRDALLKVEARLDRQSESIDDIMTVAQQQVPQPAMFQPWHDVVRIVGPTSVAMASDPYFIGFEGVVTSIYGDGEYRVQIAEVEDWFYFPASSLRLVYRLKPRAQAAPVFKAGEYVKDVRFNNLAFEVMQDSNGPSVQLRNLRTNEPEIGLADCLYKIDKPVLNIGDWIYDEETDRQEEIADVYDQVVTTKTGRILRKSLVKKIDPPAPRFKFGQRVQWRETETSWLFLRSEKRMSYICDATGEINQVFTDDLTLDTDAD